MLTRWNTRRQEHTPLQLLTLIICLVVLTPEALARIRFQDHTFSAPYQETLWVDLNGDRLKDLILINGIDLTIYYQNSKHRFAKKPDAHFALPDSPALVTPSRLGTVHECLLVLNDSGVSSFTCVKSDKPQLEKLIAQSTLLPASSDETTIVPLPFVARTATDYPLILIPSHEDLHVWRFEQGWQQVQTLPQTTAHFYHISGEQARYAHNALLSLNVADLNGDRTEDLIVCLRKQERVTYRVMLQEANGRFTDPPVLEFTDKADWSIWHGWSDINRDGRVDLVRGTWLLEPWFVPGTLSGKVLVEVFQASETGALPPQPNWIFRKNDWSPEVPLVDLDGDGYTDLVLGYSSFDGREGVRKTLTSKKLDHTLRFHCYRPESGFDSEPDSARKVELRLEQHGIYVTIAKADALKRYIQVTGDFNGDGKRDLTVRDRNDTISVYACLSRQQGFAKRPCAQFDYLGSIRRLETYDLNGDGLSDLVIRPWSSDKLPVFISVQKR